LFSESPLTLPTGPGPALLIDRGRGRQAIPLRGGERGGVKKFVAHTGRMVEVKKF